MALLRGEKERGTSNLELDVDVNDIKTHHQLLYPILVCHRLTPEAGHSRID